MESRGQGDLPREVDRGTVKVGGLEVSVVHLDNGDRIIPQEDMERLMQWLADGAHSAEADEALEAQEQSDER